MSETNQPQEPHVPYAEVIDLTGRIIGKSDGQEAPTDNDVPSQVADMHTLHTTKDSGAIEGAKGRHPSSFRQDQ